MKIPRINKIMVIQWNERAVVQDIGLQKIPVDELVRVLKKCAAELEKDYKTR